VKELARAECIRCIKHLESLLNAAQEAIEETYYPRKWGELRRKLGKVDEVLDEMERERCITRREKRDLLEYLDGAEFAAFEGEWDAAMENLASFAADGVKKAILPSLRRICGR